MKLEYWIAERLDGSGWRDWRPLRAETKKEIEAMRDERLKHMPKELQDGRQLWAEPKKVQVECASAFGLMKLFADEQLEWMDEVGLGPRWGYPDSMFRWEKGDFLVTDITIIDYVPKGGSQ